MRFLKALDCGGDIPLFLGDLHLFGGHHAVAGPQRKCDLFLCESCRAQSEHHTEYERERENLPNTLHDNTSSVFIRIINYTITIA